MRSNILGRDPSRFRNLCTGLCAALSLLGMASAHAAPFITAYETTGSAVIAGTSYDFTATLDLKNDYIAGTPLLESNFNSFNLVISTVGSEVELIFPVATLNGSIDPSSTVDTSFSVTTLPGNDFFDQNGVEYLVVP
ncbi:MAG TPA: hypothetical protein VMD06_01680, partial [Steroidobacteraceae bacterium]|nr:hypothetical protein [Steroidobacteraceae bacterium]